jgi:hypothetical protein
VFQTYLIKRERDTPKEVPKSGEIQGKKCIKNDFKTVSVRACEITHCRAVSDRERSKTSYSSSSSNMAMQMSRPGERHPVHLRREAVARAHVSSEARLSQLVVDQVMGSADDDEQDYGRPVSRDYGEQQHQHQEQQRVILDAEPSRDDDHNVSKDGKKRREKRNEIVSFSKERTNIDLASLQATEVERKRGRKRGRGRGRAEGNCWYNAVKVIELTDEAIYFFFHFFCF